MSTTRLAFEHTPPLTVPLPYFLAAPLCGVLAMFVLASGGPAALVHRWTPCALAVTHLLALGFLGTVMFGALLQMASVLGTRTVLASPRCAQLLLSAHLAGTLALAAGLYFDWSAAFLAAGLLLFPASVAFVSLALTGLWHASTDAPRVMQLAVCGLLITLGFALLLLAGHASSPPAIPRHLTDLHAVWALGGWLLMLVLGSAFEVVPMFQSTPSYPAGFRKIAGWLLAGGIAAWTLARLGEHMGLPAGALAALLTSLPLTIATLFGLLTLMLQRARRRRTPDVTRLHFRDAMLALLGAVACFVSMSFVTDPRWPVLAGTLLLCGFGAGTVAGMSYRIVPFLLVLHLHRKAFPAQHPARHLPSARDLLSENDALNQHRLQNIAIILLTAGIVLHNELVTFAACVLAAAWLLLAMHLFTAVRRYHHALHRLSRIDTDDR